MIHTLHPATEWRAKWVGHVARMVEMRNAYRILIGRSEGKIPPGLHLAQDIVQ
jgi:hypothetical protein